MTSKENKIKELSELYINYEEEKDTEEECNVIEIDNPIEEEEKDTEEECYVIEIDNPIEEEEKDTEEECYVIEIDSPIEEEEKDTEEECNVIEIDSPIEEEEKDTEEESNVIEIDSPIDEEEKDTEEECYVIEIDSPIDEEEKDTDEEQLKGEPQNIHFVPFTKDIQNTKIKKINDNEEKFIKNIELNIANKLMERHQLKCLKGNLYFYSKNKGYFIELEDLEIRTLVRTGWPLRIEGLLSKARVDDIIDRLKSRAAIQIDEDDLDCYPNLINFNDCVIDIENEEVLKHSPKYCFTSFINANYLNKQSKGRNFLKFINQCTSGDKKKIMQLQELFGYTISNYSNAKKWFVLIGQPHTGKSTILELLTDIIGEEYTSNVPLNELGGKFSLADLFKKKLNVSGELNDGVLKNISTIKAITGNDRLRADRKYKLPLNFVNRAKILMAGNSMFQLKTFDKAFLDRILFVVFNNTISEDQRDYKLKEKLSLEKDFIVQWAVEGLSRLINNNFVFTESGDSINFKQQYQNEMNNINDFIHSICILDVANDQLRVHKKDLYNAYINYSRENCQEILNKKEFFNEINKLPVKHSKFRFRKSNALYGYMGITLKMFLNQ